ncbi:MAG: flagellar biosynthetic protein FliR [Comamonadaceae bacterium]|nr:flagellar biosynthetic protein FliR [Comamonadaceae bacterium]
MAPVLGSRVAPRRLRADGGAGAGAGRLLLLVPAGTGRRAARSDRPAGGWPSQALIWRWRMGFVLRLVFGALELGGQMIATQHGAGLRQRWWIRSGAQSPLLSQFYTLLGTLVFLGLNGHLLLVAALADSFAALPVGRRPGPIAISCGQRPTGLVGCSAGAALISLPAIASLLVQSRLRRHDPRRAATQHFRGWIPHRADIGVTDRALQPAHSSAPTGQSVRRGVWGHRPTHGEELVDGRPRRRSGTHGTGDTPPPAGSRRQGSGRSFPRADHRWQCCWLPVPPCWSWDPRHRSRVLATADARRVGTAIRKTSTDAWPDTSRAGPSLRRLAAVAGAASSD